MFQTPGGKVGVLDDGSPPTLGGRLSLAGGVWGGLSSGMSLRLVLTRCGRSETGILRAYVRADNAPEKSVEKFPFRQWVINRLVSCFSFV